KPTEGDFEVIPLKHANAIEAAIALDEAFNGPQPQQQGRGGNRGGGGGRRGGFGNQQDPTQQGAPGAPAAPAMPNVGQQREDRIRVVADVNTNSLIVKATPLDVLTIRRLLRDHIDLPVAEGALAKKVYQIPLKNTSALEVQAWLQNVYRQMTGS